MRIKDILKRKGDHVHSIGPSETLKEAMSRLVEHNIGSLMVQDSSGEILGIITERDILRHCAVGKAWPDDIRVKNVMSTDLIIGLPDDELNYVMGIMTKNRIRHLPVMDGDELQGIISIGDVVNAHLREAEFENRMLRDYIHGMRV